MLLVALLICQTNQPLGAQSILTLTVTLFSAKIPDVARLEAIIEDGDRNNMSFLYSCLSPREGQFGLFLAEIAQSRVTRACVCADVAFENFKTMATKFVLLGWVFFLSERVYRLRLAQRTQNTQY